MHGCFKKIVAALSIKKCEFFFKARVRVILFILDKKKIPTFLMTHWASRFRNGAFEPLALIGRGVPPSYCAQWPATNPTSRNVAPMPTMNLSIKTIRLIMQSELLKFYYRSYFCMLCDRMTIIDQFISGIEAVAQVSSSYLTLQPVSKLRAPSKNIRRNFF